MPHLPSRPELAVQDGRIVGIYYNGVIYKAVPVEPGETNHLKTKIKPKTKISKFILKRLVFVPNYGVFYKRKYLLLNPPPPRVFYEIDFT